MAECLIFLPSPVANVMDINKHGKVADGRGGCKINYDGL